MSASLSEVLLRVAAAIAADGGASVRTTLEAVLRDAAPFDAGEVALVGAAKVSWRQPLGALVGPLLGMDLLTHVIAHGAAYRIDDWRDAEPFTETLGLLRGHPFRSLLVVPFRFERPGKPPLAGALAVARSHGWAFVGASLPLLVPLAAMAGLAFDRALVLTDLGERERPPAETAPTVDPVAEVTERLGSVIEEAHRAAGDRERERDEARAELEALRGELEGLRREAEGRRGEAEGLRREAEGRRGELEGLRRELDGLRGEAEGLRPETEGLRRDAAASAAALRDERARGETHLTRAEAAEARLSESERSRDDWAQQASSLRGHAGAQDAELQSLRREVTEARESAATAAERADAGQARDRELQEQLREREGAIRGLEAEVQARHEVARRLDDAAGRIATLEQEVRGSIEAKEAVVQDRAVLVSRLHEATEAVRAGEDERRALLSARDEGEAERARLALETARLSGEKMALEAELKQVGRDRAAALEQVAQLSTPVVPAVSITPEASVASESPPTSAPKAKARTSRGRTKARARRS